MTAYHGPPQEGKISRDLVELKERPRLFKRAWRRSPSKRIFKLISFNAKKVHINSTFGICSSQPRQAAEIHLSDGVNYLPEHVSS